jgi:hypothetical protein
LGLSAWVRTRPDLECNASHGGMAMSLFNIIIALIFAIVDLILFFI